MSKRDFTTLKTPSLSSRQATQGGFTLVEIAVSLMVIGILMGAGMIGWASYIHNFRVERTQERMDLVMQSLSRYVQTNYRLPCPANPGVTTGLTAGLEGGSNGNCLVADTGTTASATYANMQGIVPWRTLGIPQEMTKDAWGRPFTYRPSPNLTVNMFAEAMRDTADTGTSSVHQACLNEVWYETKDASGVPTHVDRAKALFCCNASPNTNFLAQTGTSLPANWRESAVFASGAITSTITENTVGSDVTAPVVISNRWAEDSTTAADRMGRFDYNPLADPMTRKASQGRTSGVGITLISHGGDGFLAFITGKGAQNRSMADVVASGTANLRVANIAQDEVLNVWPPQVSSGTVFNPKVGAGRSDITGRLTGASDDMVTYARTDQIYGFLGDASCARPKVLAAITKSQTNPCGSRTAVCNAAGELRYPARPECGEAESEPIGAVPNPACVTPPPPCPETTSCSPTGTTIFNTGNVCGVPPVELTTPRCCIPKSECQGSNRVTEAADCTTTSTPDPLCDTTCSGQVCSGGRLIESYRDIDNTCKTRDLGCCNSSPGSSYCDGCNRITVNGDCSETPPVFDTTCDASCPPCSPQSQCVPGTQIRQDLNTTPGTPGYCKDWITFGVDVSFCPPCNEGQRCGGTNNRDLITTVRSGGSCNTTTQTNHPSCIVESCSLRATPAVELLFADTDLNKVYDYIYFDPSTRLLREVPECTGAAGADSAFDVVTKACTDSTVYGLVRVNGASYEVWGRKCEDCPTGQAACMSADLTWTVGTMNCSARVPSANHNIRRSVIDTETASTPGTGTAAFLCNDGTFAPQPGATCTGDCPAMVGRTWGTSPQCAADLPAGNQGDSVTITNTVSPQTGTATYSCDNGSWVETSATCNPAGCTLNGMYQWGPGNVCQGDGTGIFIPNGGTGSVLNATSGRTGKADFTCNNGVITPGPTTCDLQQCSPATIPFGAGCSANVPGGDFGDVVTRPNTNAGFTPGSQADFTCNASGGWDISNVVCNPIINGACNTTTTSTATYTAPAAGSRCSAGNETAVTTNATTFDWSCNSPNSGTNANCSSPRNIDGDCGPSDTQTFPFATPPSSGLCNVGSESSVTTNATTYTWTCSAVNSGAVDNCTATRAPAPPPPNCPAGPVAISGGCSVNAPLGNVGDVAINLPNTNGGFSGRADLECNGSGNWVVLNSSCSGACSAWTPMVRDPNIWDWDGWVGDGCAIGGHCDGDAQAIPACGTPRAATAEQCIRNVVFSNGNNCNISFACRFEFDERTCPAATTSGGGNVNATCGAAASRLWGTTPPPAGQLCATGTAKGLTNTATNYNWSCVGSGGGVTTDCSAQRTTSTINGSCGPSHGQVATYNADLNGPSQCSTGTPTDVVVNPTTFNWDCQGINSGSTANCQATRAANTSCPNSNSFSWTDGGNTCSGSKAGGLTATELQNYGQSFTANDPVAFTMGPDYSGSATVRCINGAWQATGYCNYDPCSGC